MELKPELPLYIDSTMMSTFRSCMRKGYNNFILNCTLPGVSIDLHAGGCFASALEEVYIQTWVNKRDLRDALAVAHARFLLEWGDFEVPEWKRTAKTMDRTWEAVEHYFATWSPKTDPIIPYHDAHGNPTIEYTFAIPLTPTSRIVSDGHFPLHPSGSPFLYCGRFDMLGALAGKPVPKDDKTTGSSIGQFWASQWNLRSQFMGYVWACQQCDIPADSVAVRGIAIQKTQFTTAEALIPFSRDLISRWHEQLRRDLWRIYDAWNSNKWDYNFGDTCTAYGLCPFMDACQSAAPDNWLSSFDRRTWNPLYKDPSREPINAAA
jgi:hypothetical protein